MSRIQSNQDHKMADILPIVQKAMLQDNKSLLKMSDLNLLQFKATYTIYFHKKNMIFTDKTLQVQNQQFLYDQINPT